MALKALEKNDIVDVIAPGFGCSPEALENARVYLLKKGFKPRIPSDIFGSCPLHSNSDQARAEMLITALFAKDSKAIWFLRGGYGSNRLLPYLRKLKKKPKAKLAIGISDITSLHSFFIQNWGWSALHGSLLDRLGQGLVPADVEAELFDVVTGKAPEVSFEGLQPLNEAARMTSKIKASLLGGNLKVIESHVGTVDALKMQNRMIMFEEIGERGYRVDRMLFHLEQAKAFKGCKAVLFGTFTGSDEPNNAPSTVPWVLERWASQQNFPVVKGLPCGHDTIQRVLPLGTQAILNLSGDEATLKVKTGVRQ